MSTTAERHEFEAILRLEFNAFVEGVFFELKGAVGTVKLTRN